MAIIGTLPNNIQDGQAVDASPVMADFNFIVNQVNANAMPLGTISSGALVGFQVFSALGAFTYTPTTGANSFIAEVLGAGGAGGGVPTSVGAAAGGGGGGAGAYVLYRRVGSLTGLTGSIGTAGAPSVGIGGAGGNTTFAGVVAGGGVGGNTVVSSTAGVLGAPGLGGTSSGGTENITGAAGDFAFAITAASAISGKGADTRWGAGGQAFGENGTTLLLGSPAAGFGAGGGGALGINTNGTAIGGTGGGGLVIIYEFA
jgi:hypothetical protein